MPSALPQILRRLQDLDDAATPAGAGDNNKAYVWNNATSSFDLVALFTEAAADALYRPLDTDVPSADVVGLDTHTANATIHRSIADGGFGATDLWSANKINTEVSSVGSALTAHTGTATIHRSINDGGSSTTDLWSASKIATEIGSVSAGDFLADGSVAMTGDFQLVGNEITSTDGDTSHQLGRASIGHNNTFSDWATFAHRDHMSATNYAFVQSAGGAVVFNAPSAAVIGFANAGSNKMTMSAITLDLRALSMTSDNSDTTFVLGRSRVGYDGATSDRAIFAHRDHATAAGAAFGQTSAGIAEINAPTGQTIQFSINGSDVVRIGSTGNVGIGTTGPDTNLHVEDSTAGSITAETASVAVFEKNGDCGIQLNSPSDSDMYVYFKTPTAADNGHIRYDASVPQMKILLGTTFGYTFGQSSFHHSTDNTSSNGLASFRWTTVYATTGTINTSDRREKRDIAPSSLGLAFINDLLPVSYRWKNKIEGEKMYHGLIAQDIKGVLAKHGIDADDFAGYVDTDDKLGLRYHEFIAPLIGAVQELAARVEALEAM